jgi:hypothetical protein
VAFELPPDLVIRWSGGGAVTQKAEDNEKEKASVVRRMVQSGADLPDDRREALLRLRQKVEQLWQKREGSQTKQSGENTTTSAPNSWPLPSLLCHTSADHTLIPWLLVDDHRHLWHDRGCQTKHRSQEEPTVARPMMPAFVVIDTLMDHLGHRSDVRAQVPDSEILTIAVVAAT